MVQKPVDTCPTKSPASLHQLRRMNCASVSNDETTTAGRSNEAHTNEARSKEGTSTKDESRWPRPQPGDAAQSTRQAHAP
jgi:hypothetical protein